LLEIFTCNDQMIQIDLIINYSWILISFLTLTIKNRCLELNYFRINNEKNKKINVTKCFDFVQF
jgi:hypothetical protein